MRTLAWIALLAPVLGCPVPSNAATPSGALSLDRYDAPDGQVTTSALGVGDLAFGGTDVLAGVLRFDNTAVGAGTGFVLGGGATLTGSLSMRVLGSRFVGDGDYRAWRIKAGPQWGLPGGGTLGISWVHDTSNLGPDTESGAGELTIPVAHDWTAKLDAAYGRSEESDGYVATVGAAWKAIPHVELSGEVGAARNPPSTTPAPSRGLSLPILGGGPRSQEVAAPSVAATSTLTLRVTLP